MLPLAELDRGGDGRSGVNLLAITPGTSLKFGQSTGRFPERCLAYAFLRAHWGAGGDERAGALDLLGGRLGRATATSAFGSRGAGTARRSRASLDGLRPPAGEADRRRVGARPAAVARPVRRPRRRARAGSGRSLTSSGEERGELIGEVRRIMAIVGISALQSRPRGARRVPALQGSAGRPIPANFAAELAHRLFNHVDPETGRPTRTLLLSATPYRMYTTADEAGRRPLRGLPLHMRVPLPRRDARPPAAGALRRAARRAHLHRLARRRGASSAGTSRSELRSVMARTERLAATPDRDGMLAEHDALRRGRRQDDLRSYLRLRRRSPRRSTTTSPPSTGSPAPTSSTSWSATSSRRRSTERHATGKLPGERLGPGPGLLTWDDVEAYEPIDPQNGRLRWLLEDLERHRAFELLWIPPSLRYYDAGSVYETDAALTLHQATHLLGLGGGPEGRLRARQLRGRAPRLHRAASHSYSADYRRRGGQRLDVPHRERAAPSREPASRRRRRRRP